MEKHNFKSFFSFKIILENDLKYVKTQHEFELNEIRSKYEEQLKRLKEQEVFIFFDCQS